MTEPLLQMRDLRIETEVNPRDKNARPVEILKGIDLTLNRGEVLGLIGESGAGKSTIGLAALGFARRGLRLSGGEVWLDGKELRRAPEDVLRNIRGQKVAYVAQSAAAAFNPAHRLLSQVLEVTNIHHQMDTGKAAKRAVELFGRMGLPHPEEFGKRYPHEVSGGQLQRAMTAMALAGEPDLLVFDEPTTALDVTTQIDVLAIIKDVIRDFGSAALYITHDLGVVAQIADRIKVLRHGQEVEEQETAALLANPREDYTRDLLNVRRASTDANGTDRDETILALDHIDAAYGAVQVLWDVSVALRRGTCLAIVGESGSGKSTLARVIMGLLPPVKGQITYQGDALSGALVGRSTISRKAIQMVYQLPDVAMNPRQNVGEIIGRPAQVFLGLSRTAARERAKELLELVDLPPDMIDRFPNQLSGGQKQRVCIARALAAEPDTVICDEVTSALDPLVAEGITELLLRLQRKLGVSYIFITHDMAMVRAIADDVVVMQNGRVVEQGPKDTIFEPPHADYTHLLISSTPEMRTDWLETVLQERRMEAAGN
ncbi:ABC transporter ATP-binding protein [Aliiroseovarius sp. YM-037]|uniref:ABC transporter ATP-binding protein n=1 Tax=Aliiroseovarius sp. YM-037 TaxID=3341728 RepID=UPI003A807B48